RGDAGQLCPMTVEVSEGIAADETRGARHPAGKIRMLGVDPRVEDCDLRGADDRYLAVGFIPRDPLQCPLPRIVWIAGRACRHKPDPRCSVLHKWLGCVGGR